MPPKSNMHIFQAHLTNNVQSIAKYDVIVVRLLYILDYIVEQEFRL